MTAPRAAALAARTVTKPSTLRSSMRHIQTSKLQQLPRVASAQQQRCLHTPPPRRSGEASNPAMSFPCLDALEIKTAKLSARSMESGPEPSYTSGATEKFHSKEPLHLDWGGVLPEYDIAYETWGQLNSDKSNAILLHTGLSASSHAHSTESNPKPGWWEKLDRKSTRLNSSHWE